MYHAYVITLCMRSIMGVGVLYIYLMLHTMIVVSYAVCYDVVPYQYTSFVVQWVLLPQAKFICRIRVCRSTTSFFSDIDKTQYYAALLLCSLLSEKEQRIQTALENVGQIWPNNARLHLFPAHSTSCRVTTQPLLVSSLFMSSMFPSLVFPYTTLDQKKCKPHHLLLSRFQTLNVLSLKCRLIFLQASD